MVTEYSFPKILSISLLMCLMSTKKLISVMLMGFEYTNSATKHPDGLLFMYSFLFLILVDSIRTPSSISRFDNSCDNFFDSDNIVDKLILY